MLEARDAERLAQAAVALDQALHAVRRIDLRHYLGSPDLKEEVRTIEADMTEVALSVDRVSAAEFTANATDGSL